MYLAKCKKDSSLHYLIRQSYYDEKSGEFTYRNIFDLGSNPQEFIEMFDDQIFFFTEELEAAVGKCTERDPTLLLEELLWIYIPRHIRDRLTQHRGHQKTYNFSLKDSEREAIEREIHIFDRRRLYFLRYNAVDQSRLYRMHEKLCRPLLGQCRDEREYYFQEQEKVLQPGELKTYVYAIFNLQKHFQEYFSTFMPEALDPESMAKVFEEEICILNDDKSFWGSSPQSSSLHHHLQRYLFFFFDYSFSFRSFNNEFVRNFQNSHRVFRWPQKNKITSEELSSAFDEKFEILNNLDRKELTRLFRKRAKALHPDTGGDHEAFILLCRSYEQLLAQKGAKPI